MNQLHQRQLKGNATKPSKYKEGSAKKKSASKPTTPLAQIRGAVGNRSSWGPLHTAMNAAKTRAPTGMFARLQQLARTSHMLKVAQPAVNFKQTKVSLRSVPPLDSTSLNRELTWAAFTLNQVRETVEKFSALKNDYLRAILECRFNDAILILDKVDKLCGASLWSIENRIAILGYAFGFQEQRSYVQALSKEYKRSFLAFYINNVSERNEGSVSLAGYELRLRSRANHWQIDPAHKRYIFFKLLGELSCTDSNYAEILAFEAASSPIDLYETFITIVSSLVERKDENSVIPKVIENLGDLNSSEIINLRMELGIGGDFPTCCSPAYLESYLKGDVEHASIQAQAELRADPLNGLALIVSAYADALGHGSPMQDGVITSHIINLYSQLLSQSEESDSAAAELEKICLNFRSLPYSSYVRKWLKNRQIASMYQLDVETFVRGGIPSSIIHPERIFDQRQCGKSSALREYLELEAGRRATSSELSLENSILAQVFGLRSRHKNSEALAIIKVLEESPNDLFCRWAKVFYSWLLYEDGDIEGAIETSVDIAVNSIWLTTVLPLMNVIRSRGFKELKAMQHRASLPIAFFLYGYFARANEKDVALKVSWKQYLKAHGVTLPSSLNDIPADQSYAHVLFFLRNVCSQEVMEMGVDFRSPQDLDKERLRICVKLSQLDPENSSYYEEEIIELNRRLSIEDGVKQVESSRVYVDVLGLERWCFSNLNETFLRYIDYTGENLTESIREIERELQDILKSRGNIRDISDYLNNYDITADSLLADLIEECCSSFMTLPRHGLDAFLGSRVRHGSLEGIFRSPLESARLVTKKSAVTGEYVSNNFWIDEISEVNVRSRVDSLLRGFSRSIDELLDRAVTELVYVKTDAKQQGLIWMFGSEEEKRTTLSRWVIQAKLRLAQKYSLDQLVRYCAYDLFWPTLSRNLELVQNYMRCTLTGEICRGLDELSSALKPCMHPTQFTAIKSHVHAAKESILGAGEKLASWFHVPSEPEQLSAYDLRTAMEIGIRSVQTIRPGFDPEVLWTIDHRANIMVHRGALEIINDAAYLIFGNISKHSGFLDSIIGRTAESQVAIAIEWIEPNSISVSVLSDVSPYTDLALIEDRVSKAKAEIQARQFEAATLRTKGSGLVRLAFLLNHESSTDISVDFGLQSGRKFFVNFSVPVYFLRKDQE